MQTYADISLVIPAYDGDINLLPDLLQQIYGFTVLPKEIIVVASGLINLEVYLNDFTLLPQPELIRCQISKRINQAKARNIGAKFATRKLIMFHDVDDLPHPQKFQITEMVFNNDPSLDYLVHAYSMEGGIEKRNYFQESLKLDYGLMRHPTTMGLASSTGMPVHNSHITFHKKIFDKNQLQFDESNKAFRMEDSLLTQKIYAQGLEGVMVCAELVQYRPSTSRA